MSSISIKYKIYSVMSLLLCVSLAGLAHASEVTLLHKGLLLNAKLELATNKQYADGMILITHVGLAHNGMESIIYLQDRLKQFGYNTLAINLSLGLNNRHGMYDCKTPHRHRFTDAADEINAWMDWLQGKGVSRVTLLGHSRGAGQTALYASERDNALVNAVVLLAPDTLATNDAAAYQQRHHQPLKPILEKAQKLVGAGKGNTVLEHTGILFCSDTSVSADTIVSYYGSDPRLDTPFLIPKIGKPTLILIAGSDEVIKGFNTRFAPLSSGKNVTIKTIEGADHFFRDLYTDDAVDGVNSFITNLHN